MVSLVPVTHQRCWPPLVGGGRGWCPQTYHLASVPIVLEIGNLFMRRISKKTKDCEEVVDSSDSDRGQVVEASDSDRGVESGSSSLQEDVHDETFMRQIKVPQGQNPQCQRKLRYRIPGHAWMNGLAGSTRPMAYIWAGSRCCGLGRARKHSQSTAVHTGALCASHCENQGLRARYIC